MMKNINSVVVSYILKLFAFVLTSFSLLPVVFSQAISSSDLTRHSTSKTITTSSQPATSSTTHVFPGLSTEIRRGSFLVSYLFKVVTFVKRSCAFVTAVNTPAAVNTQVVTFVIPTSTLAPAVDSRATSSPDPTHSIITERTLPSSAENGRKGTDASVSTHRDRSTSLFPPIYTLASNFTKVRARVVNFLKRSCCFLPAVDTPATSSTNHSDEIMPTPRAFNTSMPTTLSKENRCRWKRFVQGTKKKKLNFIVQQMSKVVSFVMASCTLVPAVDSRVTSYPDHTNSVIIEETMPSSTMETCTPATPTENVGLSGRCKMLVRAIKTKLMTPACRKKGADAGFFMQRDHSSSLFPHFSLKCMFVPPPQARKTTFGRALKNTSMKFGRRLAQAWPKKVEGNQFSTITAKRLKKLNRMAHTPPQLSEEEIDPIMIREIESQRSSSSSPFSLPSFRNMKCTLGDLFQHEMAGTQSQCSSSRSSFSFTSTMESEYIGQSPERMMIHQHESYDNNDCSTSKPKAATSTPWRKHLPALKKKSSNQQFNSDLPLDVPPRLSQLWSDEDTRNVDDWIGDEELVSNYQMEEKNQELSFAAKMYFEE